MEENLVSGALLWWKKTLMLSVTVSAESICQFGFRYWTETKIVVSVVHHFMVRKQSRQQELRPYGPNIYWAQIGAGENFRFLVFFPQFLFMTKPPTWLLIILCINISKWFDKNYHKTYTPGFFGFLGSRSHGRFSSKF